MTDQTPLPEALEPEVDEADAIEPTEPAEEESLPEDSTPSDGTPTAPAALQTEPPGGEGALPPLTDDSYDFEKATITIAIQLLPSDGDPNGRPAVIGIRNGADAPIIKGIRTAALLPLPECLSELIEQLKAELPTRQFKHIQAKTKQKAKPKPAVTAARPQAASKPAVLVPPASPHPAPSAPAAASPSPKAPAGGQLSMFDF